ncbi:hypothetical protein BH10BAC6_BH10BAC6_11420 [soil metagenome]
MKPYLIFILCVSIGWLFAMFYFDAWHLFATHWPASLTMVFGAFLAGASAEGGGAVAFPVFTLVLHVPPPSARNFAFAIQSIGMVSASVLIIGKKIPVDWRAIVIPAPAGVIGMIVGTWYLVPLLDPALTKLFFVSVWFAMGAGLWIANRRKTRHVLERAPTESIADIVRLLFTGLLGGVITSFFGTGIGIVLFCLLSLYYGVSEKVATPTSVISMSILTVVGFLFHAEVLRDFKALEWSYWMVAIPVVMIMAPLGSFMISKLHRLTIARILYAVVSVQFVAAMTILGTTWQRWGFVVIVLALGLWLMITIDRSSKQTGPTASE